ncbi:ABC transporter ATP-binding protein [Parathalassolituus penaei]|uniref:ABC transporter ATP-binding protein n=1 Tax=Parathalassolituus penaei TaxID=2997323 RepID=A0A9X3IR17_9GAMM|nr:ABC transporter ATP-binding protein [Parathalassolituus penaei]MCY0963770.1 ABC transporter ATP-binding protein [Parathalassolituus penaei]
MNSPLLQASGLRKHFDQGDNRIDALQGIDLCLEAGAMVAITGHSGSGKSTLLNIIGTLETPDAGELVLWGNPVRWSNRSADVRQREQLREQGLGFIFQNFNLNPALTALENVSLPLLLGNDSRRQREQKAAAMLERVGLGERLHHRPGQLSGGQQQRVAVARALVRQPRLLLADEPTANLDSQSTSLLLELLAQLNRDLGTAMLFSSHDERLLATVPRQYHLQDGRIQTCHQPETSA